MKVCENVCNRIIINFTIVNNVEDCPEDRCKNGGNCTYATVNSKFTVVGCDCPKGFTGSACEDGMRFHSNSDTN